MGMILIAARLTPDTAGFPFPCASLSVIGTMGIVLCRHAGRQERYSVTRLLETPTFAYLGRFHIQYIFGTGQ